MISKTDADFWRYFAALPPEIKRAAKKQFALWRANHYHSTLQFKRVGVYMSVRIGKGYRALGVMADKDTITWYWIGPHDEYLRRIDLP